MENDRQKCSILFLSYSITQLIPNHPFFHFNVVQYSVRTDQQNLFNILGSMYTGVIFLGINNCATVLQYIATERTVMYREKFVGMYSPLAFSVAQVHFS